MPHGRSLAFSWLLREPRSELGKLLLKLRYPLRGLLGGRGSWLSWLRRGCGPLGGLQEHRQIATYLRLSEHLEHEPGRADADDIVGEERLRRRDARDL